MSHFSSRPPSERPAILAIDCLGATADLLADATDAIDHRLIILSGSPERILHDLGEHRCDAGHIDVIACDVSDIASIRRCVPAGIGPQDIAGILIQSDRAAIAGATYAQSLDLPAHSVAAMRICRDKAQTRRALSAAGIQTILFSEVSSLSAAIERAATFGYPLIVKDPNGTGSAHVYVVDDEAALRPAVEAILTNRGVVLLEEFLRGPLFSAECAIQGDDIHILGYSNRDLSRFPDFNELGLVFPADIPQSLQSRTASYVCDVVRAMGLRQGFAHIEFILAQDGPHIVEVNPRMGGCALGRIISLATGTNIFETAVAISLNRPMTHSSATPGDHIACKVLCAETAGRIESIRGVERLSAFPGFLSAHLIRRKGDPILSTRDYRNTVGYIIAAGETPSLAYDFVRAAEASLSVQTLDERAA